MSRNRETTRREQKKHLEAKKEVKEKERLKKMTERQRKENIFVWYHRHCISKLQNAQGHADRDTDTNTEMIVYMASVFIVISAKQGLFWIQKH